MITDTPAKRNRKIRIEKPTESTSAGKTTRTWATFCFAWVSIAPIEGRELWEAQRQESSVTHKITGTWGDFRSVTADFRIQYGSRTFNLLEPPRNIEEVGVLAEVMVEEVLR